MPYIKQIDREDLIRWKEFNYSVQLPDNEGELNYLISYFIKEYMNSRGMRYKTLNEIMGVLECAKQEFYRRVVIPYEDSKIEQNGDVY